MKIFWILALLIPVCGYGQIAERDSVEALRSLTKDGSVRKIESLRMPDDVETLAAVTPEVLRSHASYTVTFSDDLGRIFGPLLAAASFKNSDESSDLRWGILFNNASGKEIDAIFVDRFGEKGYLNGKAGRFGSNLAKGLSTAAFPCWRTRMLRSR